MQKNNKRPLYEYIVISDTTSYFNKIVIFEELIFDLEKNVIFNENLNNYKKDTFKKINILNMNTYYGLGNIIKLNKVTGKCLKLFHEMFNIEIHDLLIKNNFKFYELTKNNKLNDKNISNTQKNSHKSNNYLLIIDLFNIQQVKLLINYIDSNKDIYEKILNQYVLSGQNISNMFNKIVRFRDNSREKKKRIEKHIFNVTPLYNNIIIKTSNNIKECLTNLFYQYIMNELYIKNKM